MYGAMLLFESEFVHIVAISFTSLILTELLMVALTIQTWHWLMIVGELLSLACYVASLVFLHEFIGERDRQKKKTHIERFAMNRVSGQALGAHQCRSQKLFQVRTVWGCGNKPLGRSKVGASTNCPDAAVRRRKYQPVLLFSCRPPGLMSVLHSEVRW